MTSNKKLYPYFTLGLLILIFVGPLVAAIILYSQHPVWLMHNTLNKGQLLTSPLYFNTLKKQLILKKNRHNPWQIFYLAKTDCKQYCQQRLHRLKQVILALGKNRNQVSAFFIQATQASKIKDNELSHYLITKNEYYRFFTAKKVGEGYYLVDPQGKIILYYPATVPSENLYKDLIHLLQN